MTVLPPRRTRRYELVKFIYTTDNGETLVTGQFHYKDENGGPFFELSRSFLARVIQGRRRDKFWGDPSRLRKAEVQYPEPRNQTGIGEAVFYIPYRPNDGCLECFLEIRELVKSKFKASEQIVCTAYRGENRYTIDRPRRLNEVLE